MRTDTIILLPALAIALYQIKLWKSLPENENVVINGKYQMIHFVAFIFAKFSCYMLFTIQLFYYLFKITDENVPILYVLGYIFVILGLMLSTNALKELKGNWNSMMFYKIIPNHRLIKTGVYKHIRHPIYSAIILEVVGYELIANSWLFVFFIVASTLAFNIHVKNEEKLLIKHFGQEYVDYKNQTNKYIPYIY